MKYENDHHILYEEPDDWTKKPETSNRSLKNVKQYAMEGKIRKVKGRSFDCNYNLPGMRYFRFCKENPITRWELFNDIENSKEIDTKEGNVYWMDPKHIRQYLRFGKEPYLKRFINLVTLSNEYKRQKRMEKNNGIDDGFYDHDAREYEQIKQNIMNGNFI